MSDEKTKLPTEQGQERKKPFWFRLFRIFAAKPINRAYIRLSCNIPTILHLKGLGYPLKGELKDISPAGCLFRPRAKYLLKLHDEPVIVEFGDERIEGQIVNTLSRGYGINFNVVYPDSFPRYVLDQCMGQDYTAEETDLIPA